MLMPGSSSNRTNRTCKNRLFTNENELFQNFCSPISWGAEIILPPPVVLSREKCKKVTAMLQTGYSLPIPWVFHKKARLLSGSKGAE